MSSNALAEWRSVGLGRLTELEMVHAQLTGTGRGRRWGTTQLNRSLFVALAAQFQSFCRDLHDEAVAVHVAAANPAQAGLLRVLLTEGRKLDVGNARKSTLGSDFGKLGFDFIGDLKATGVATERRLVRLESLVDYRNAIGHGSESKIEALEQAKGISSTKVSYQVHRQALNGLAGTMDSVVATRLAAALGCPTPW